MRYVDDYRDREPDREFDRDLHHRLRDDTRAAADYEVVSAYPVGDAYRAYQILHLAFVLIPIVAGLDKFFHYLVNWNQYLSPQIIHLGSYLGIEGSNNIMFVVGVVEIVAGLLVA